MQFATTLWQTLNTLYGPEPDKLTKSDWLSFSATIGAALLALGAAGFTIVRMNRQISLMRDQIQLTEAHENRKDLLQLATEKERLILEWTFTKDAPSHELVRKLIERRVEKGDLPGDRDYEIVTHHETKLVKIQSTDKPLKFPQILEFSGPVHYVKSAIDLFGEDEVRKRYADQSDEFFNIRPQISSIAGSYYHLVFVVRDLVSKGFGIDEAAVLLGATRDISQVLYRIGAIDQVLYDLSKFFSDVGLFDFRTIKIEMSERWLQELISSNLIGRDTKPSDLVTEIMQHPDSRDYVFKTRLKSDPQKRFVREARKWKAEAEPQNSR